MQLLWLIARGATRLFELGKLGTPTDKEIEATAREAVPLLKRVPIIALILTFLGFPLAFLKLLANYFTPAPKKEAPDAGNTGLEIGGPPTIDAPAPAAPPAPEPASFHPNDLTLQSDPNANPQNVVDLGARR